MMLKTQNEISAARPVDGLNIVYLYQRVTLRHTELLARWLQAGRRMGLCNAEAFHPGRHDRQRDYILVWVRENADPAYMVHAEGTGWVVTDTVRQAELAQLSSFEAALHFIRPVLPFEAAA
jgi:hypothetical protein